MVCIYWRSRAGLSLVVKELGYDEHVVLTLTAVRMYWYGWAESEHHDLGSIIELLLCLTSDTGGRRMLLHRRTSDLLCSFVLALEISLERSLLHFHPRVRTRLQGSSVEIPAKLPESTFVLYN